MRRLGANARTLAGLAVAGTLAVGVWQWHAAADLQRRLEAVAYYRVRSSYVVRDTGERVDFAYVAACAVLETRHRDSDRPMDTPFGVAPNTFIMRAQGGHAIHAATPRACNREAETGDIPGVTRNAQNPRFMNGMYTAAASSLMSADKPSVEFANEETRLDWKFWRDKAKTEETDVPVRSKCRDVGRASTVNERFIRWFLTSPPSVADRGDLPKGAQDFAVIKVLVVSKPRRLLIEHGTGWPIDVEVLITDSSNMPSYPPGRKMRVSFHESPELRLCIEDPPAALLEKEFYMAVFQFSGERSGRPYAMWFLKNN